MNCIGEERPAELHQPLRLFGTTIEQRPVLVSPVVSGGVFTASCGGARGAAECGGDGGEPSRSCAGNQSALGEEEGIGCVALCSPVQRLLASR